MPPSLKFICEQAREFVLQCAQIFLRSTALSLHWKGTIGIFGEVLNSVLISVTSCMTSCMILLGASATVMAQQPKPAVKGAVAKGAAAPRTTTVTKGTVQRGSAEKYDCKVGTEDNHARMALLSLGGEVQSIAYYGKWKPRTCSVHLQRGDAYSKWKDTGDATTITTEYGDFLVQVSRAEFHVFFRQVDRMHYCGMMGKLNGSMLVARGAKRTCTVEGIMDRNETEKMDEQLDQPKPAEAAASPVTQAKE